MPQTPIEPASRPTPEEDSSWQRPRVRQPDEAGSMAMYLTLAVVGLAIAALLVPMLITQTRVTRLDTTRVHAVDAAHAGIDLMVGRIRAAESGGVGEASLLPCAPLSGSVDAVSQAAFEVRVDYYTVDPVAVPTAAKMRCVEGYGTFEPETNTFTPRYARITSKGTDGLPFAGGTGGRTLATTYVLQIDNSIRGGRIQLNSSSGSSVQLCLDAGPNPVDGGTIRLQPCATPLIPQQTWVYRSDLTIQLPSSVTPTYPDGLCLDTERPLTDGIDVELGVCAALGSAKYRQVWSYSYAGGFHASNATLGSNGNLFPHCITASSPTPGVLVVIGSCEANGQGTDPVTQSWIPDVGVGIGGAEAPQLVNYSEYGRCLDVPNQDVTTDHLISFGCMQNPYRAAIGWSQKWTTPAIPAGADSGTGQVYVTKDGVSYCLTSSSVSGMYVTVSGCSTDDPRQVWTVDGGDTRTRYSVRYTIVDSEGRCLGLSHPVSGEKWSAVVAETCTGATDQKWNAPPNLTSATLQDLEEL